MYFSLDLNYLTKLQLTLKKKKQQLINELTILRCQQSEKTKLE